MIVCNCIRSFRLKRGMTQSELADLIGVTKNTISAYETGTFQPRLVNCFSLMSVFECSFEDLFSLGFKKEIRK